MPRVLMDETFVRTWPDDQTGSAWFAADGYRLSARQPGEFVAVRAPLANLPPDIIVSGTFRKVGGPPGGGYGLILDDQGLGAGDGRDQSGEFVVAEVGDRGDVGVWRRHGTRWVDLVAWTPSHAVHVDSNANDLTVELLSGRLTFLVNGEQVVDLSSTSAAGMPLQGVGVFTGGDLNEVVVSRFRVQAPGPPVDLSALPDQSRSPAPTPQSRPSTAPPVAQPTPVSAPASRPGPPDPQRVRDLLAGIASDMWAIADSFSGGPNDPHGPVSDPERLKQDSTQLAEATGKAYELLAELQRMPGGALGGR